MRNPLRHRIRRSVLRAFASLGLIALCLLGCSSDENNPSSSSSGTPNNPNPNTGTVTDIDGNSYLTVKIGDQWWMAENLKVTKYRNGDPIPEIADDSLWMWGNIGGYCHVENNPSLTSTYGFLYNGFAVHDPRNIAPEGWHVPSDSEWQVLQDYLGATNAGGKTKTTGTTHWNSPNLGATNESGFSALPAGVRPPAGVFTNRGEIAFFWTTTQAIPPPLVSNYLRGMGYAETTFRNQAWPWQGGLSLRCIKDPD